MLLKLLTPSRFRTREIPQGVSELYSTNINNSEQWLLARGQSKNLPLLLMLHGGPGFTDMWLSEHGNSELEKHFIVVNWDQRGAGKSFDKKANPKRLTIEQFVDDAKVVIDHLLEKFGQEKLFLFGHSWGSVIGWQLAREIPEKLHHYISLGQVVHPVESEKRSLEFTVEEAKKAGNTKAIKELENITMPAPNDGKDPFKPLMVQRKWLAWYGGMMHGQQKLSTVSKHMMGAKEYSFADMLRFNNGMKQSIKQLWPQLLQINLLNQSTETKTPVTFIAGKYDHTVDIKLTEDLYHKIESPSKNFNWLEAAHLGNITQPVALAKCIIEIKDE